MNKKDALKNIPKVVENLKKYIHNLEEKGEAHLEAGFITVEYKGRLNKEAKESGVRKAFNAYGRRCNVLDSMTTNFNLTELHDNLVDYLKKYGLDDMFAITSRLI